jgi:transposase
MRGRPNRQPNLFVQINLEELVPADHPLRPIKRMADEALAAMNRTFAAAYCPAERGGRPSIPPERLLKSLVLMSLYTVRSERALCERITFDMLFRWFLDMTPDEPCFDHSVLSVNRERLDRLDITKKFSDRIVMMAMDEGLLSQDHFSIDGSLLQSHASLKSLKRIERDRAAAQEYDDGPDGPDGSGGKVGNPWVDFRGQK